MTRCRGGGGSGSTVSGRADFNNTVVAGMSRCRGTRGSSGAGVTRVIQGLTLVV